MEYVGLLGLIGLIGYFASRSLSDKFKNLQGTVHDTESRITRNNEFISDLQNELNRLGTLLQNYATRTDLNNFSADFLRQIKGDLQRVEKSLNAELKNYAELSSVKNLENKLSDLPKTSDLQNLQSALQELKRNIASLEVRISDGNSEPDRSPVKILEQRIATLEADNQNLVKKNAELSAQILQHQNYFTQIQTTFNNQQAFNKNLESNVDTFSKEVELQKKINDEFDARIKKLESFKETPTLTIKDFHIKKSNRLFFTNEPRDAERSLATAEKVTEIIDFLKKSNFSKKENFIQLLENYYRNLQKFADKLKRGKFDEDNFSEEASKAFFSVLSKYLLMALPVSIYRGIKENPAFYAAFLKKINSYLAACNVYTELVEPNKLMTHGDLEKMNVIKKTTDVKNKDKLIDEVERLPYFLDYLNEDDEIEYCSFEGTMTVMKFEGGAK